MRYQKLFERYAGKVRGGKWYRMNCPFHKDTDASLDVDLTKSGFHCFVERTPVLTEKGLIDIESLSIGNKVYDINGDLQKIIQIHQRFSDDLYIIKVRGIIDPIIATGDHKILVQKVKDCAWGSRKGRKCISSCFVTNLDDNSRSCSYKYYEKYKEEWVRVKDVLDSKIVVKALDVIMSGLGVGEKMAFVLGYYAADGWLQRSSVNFATYQNEKEFIINTLNQYFYEVFGADGAKFYKRKNRPKFYKRKNRPNYKGIEFHYNFGFNKELLNYFKQVGCGAYNKTVPLWLFNTKEELESFIAGYFRGDGTTNDRGQKSITTISRSMAYSLQTALLSLDRVAFTQYFNKHYIITWADNKKVTSGFFKDGAFWRYANIELCKKRKKQKVFDLTVTGSHTYNVSNIVVHNCWGCNKTGNHRELIMQLERVSETAAENIISKFVEKRLPITGLLGRNKYPKEKVSYLDELNTLELFVPINSVEFKKYLQGRKIAIKLANSFDFRQGSSIESGWANRIVYPIRDLYGNLCSVEGRTILKDNTFLRYKKWTGSKATLGIFGIDKIPISEYGKRILIVEGAFDALSCISVGYLAVALACSEISGVQMSQLRKVTNYPLVILDGVKPGTEKARESVLYELREKFSKKFNKYKVVQIPYKDTDPNDLLRSGKLKKYLRSVINDGKSRERQSKGTVAERSKAKRN